MCGEGVGCVGMPISLCVCVCVCVHVCVCVFRPMPHKKRCIDAVYFAC